MKIVLASMISKTNGIIENKNKILDLLNKYSKKVDLIVFGEAFLQGFYALNFNYERDINIAISVNNEIIDEIKNEAKINNVAVSFGFIEKEKEFIYSSQITISSNGEIIDVFRRVSPGWKEPSANTKYIEGNNFHIFNYLNIKFTVGLCGDLWFDKNIELIKAIKPDVVLWPVYTDFSPSKWNESLKYDYCSQANKICNKVVYVNSVCVDQPGEEIAKGGSAFFSNGCIVHETLSGDESELIILI